MASKKKDQHLVPKCYLKGFLSTVRPIEYSTYPIFKPGVWIREKSLSEDWEFKSINNPIFKKPYFYNLPNDKKESPAIEVLLGYYETKYTPIKTQKLDQTKSLTTQETFDLSIFAMMLFFRSEKQQDNLSTTFTQIGKFFGESGQGREYSDEERNALIEHLKQRPKQLLAEIDLSKAIFDLSPQFIVNTTDLPFITSDAPVVHRMAHSDEIRSFIGSSNNIDNSFLPNDPRAAFLMPVSPVMLMLASPFLVKGDTFPFIYCDCESAIVAINKWIHANAGKVVISANPIPFVGDEIQFKEQIRISNDPNLLGDWLLVYTVKNRYWLPIKDWLHDGYRFDFLPRDLKILAQIENDKELLRIEYVGANGSGGMRDVELTKVDLSGQLHSRIETKVKVPVPQAKS